MFVLGEYRPPNMWKGCCFQLLIPAILDCAKMIKMTQLPWLEYEDLRLSSAGLPWPKSRKMMRSWGRGNEQQCSRAWAGPSTLHASLTHILLLGPLVRASRPTRPALSSSTKPWTGCQVVGAQRFLVMLLHPCTTTRKYTLQLYLTNLPLHCHCWWCKG